MDELIMNSDELKRAHEFNELDFKEGIKVLSDRQVQTAYNHIHTHLLYVYEYCYSKDTNRYTKELRSELALLNRENNSR